MKFPQVFLSVRGFNRVEQRNLCRWRALKAAALRSGYKKQLPSGTGAVIVNMHLVILSAENFYSFADEGLLLASVFLEDVT